MYWAKALREYEALLGERGFCAKDPRHATAPTRQTNNVSHHSSAAAPRTLYDISHLCCGFLLTVTSRNVENNTHESMRRSCTTSLDLGLLLVGWIMLRANQVEMAEGYPFKNLHCQE